MNKKIKWKNYGRNYRKNMINKPIKEKKTSKSCNKKKIN